MIHGSVKRYLLPALIFPLAAWAAEGAFAQQAAPQPQAQPAVAPAVSPPSNAAYGLLKDIETLKAEVARLRGQNEMLEHKLESLSKRQSDLYLDLDKRVEDLRKQARDAAQASAQPVAAGTAANDDPLAESKAYEARSNSSRLATTTRPLPVFPISSKPIRTARWPPTRSTGPATPTMCSRTTRMPSSSRPGW